MGPFSGVVLYEAPLDLCSKIDIGLSPLAGKSNECGLEEGSSRACPLGLPQSKTEASELGTKSK